MARPDKISGADINSICQEVSRNLKVSQSNSNKLVLIVVLVLVQAGMLAVRENRYIVLAKDFEKAYKTVIKKDEQEHEFYK